MTELVTLAVLGPWEIGGILVIALLLFGSKKLPELARGLGTGLKEFKKATSEVTNDLQKAIDEEPAHRPAPPEPSPTPKSYDPESDAKKTSNSDSKDS